VKILPLIITVVFAAVMCSCGNVSETKSEEGNYTAGALAKMEMLLKKADGGDTEVTAKDTGYGAVYTVTVRDADGWISTYSYDFFTTGQKSLFKSVVKSFEETYGSKLVEVSDADLYCCIRFGSWPQKIDFKARERFLTHFRSLHAPVFIK
jgi:hypothetical protein